MKELSPEQPALISALKKDIIKMTILKYYPGHKIKTGLQFPDVKLLQLKKVEEVLSANHPNPHLEWLKGMLILKGESGALTADPQYYNDDLVRNMIISAVVNAYGDNDSPEQEQKKFNDLKAYMDNLKQNGINLETPMEHVLKFLNLNKGDQASNAERKSISELLTEGGKIQQTKQSAREAKVKRAMRNSRVDGLVRRIKAIKKNQQVSVINSAVVRSGARAAISKAGEVTRRRRS